MNSTVAAVHCVVDAEGNVFLDPTQKQEKNSVASFTFAFESRDRSIILAKGTGEFSNEQYHKCLAASQTAASDVFDMFRTAMKKKLRKM